MCPYRLAVSQLYRSITNGRQYFILVVLYAYCLPAPCCTVSVMDVSIHK